MNTSCLRSAVLCLLVVTGIVAATPDPDFDRLANRALSEVDTNPSEAVELFKQGLAGHPDWPEGWLYMGTCLFKLGRFPEARDALKRGVQLQPGKGTSWAFLGMAEFELGDRPAALQDILKGESLGLADNGQFVAAVRYRAAVIYLSKADFVDAVKQLRPLATLNLESEPITEAFGLAVLKLRGEPGKLDPAVKPLVDAAGRAAWAYEGERTEEAKQRFSELVQRFPDSPGVHYLYGVYLIDKDPGASARQFEQELVLSPRNANAHGQLALLYLNQDKTAEALKQAEQAVRLAPKDPWTEATLGRVLLQSGQTKQAIAALQASIQLAPDTSLTHYYLERAYRKAGDTSAAQKEKQAWMRLRAKEEPETIASP